MVAVDRVHAFIYLDPDARGGDGPLAGTTLGVKDTQPVAGMPWTYGSAKWRDRVATEDAVVVARAAPAERLNEAAAGAGLELLRVVSPDAVTGGEPPACAAAIVAEDLAPRIEAP